MIVAADEPLRMAAASPPLVSDGSQVNSCISGIRAHLLREKVRRHISLNRVDGQSDVRRFPRLFDKAIF
jgi:hypothetical protein